MSEPVRMDLIAVLIDAPKDLQAAWAIVQVLDNLKLGKQERLALLRYLTVREESEEAPF